MSKLKWLGQMLAALSCLGAAFAILVHNGLPEPGDFRRSKNESALYAAPEIGSPAPNFSLNRVQGAELSLDRIDDEIIVINFWATWCGPCRWEMRNLQQLVQEYPGQLRILAVNLGESADAVKRWVAANGLSYDVLLDPQNEVSRAYQIRGAPTTFLLDRTRRIRRIYFGTVSIQFLLRDMERLSGRA